MYRAIVLAVLAVAGLAAACGDGGSREELASGKGPLTLRLERVEGVYHVGWDDQAAESKYRVSGTAIYWPLCAMDNPDWTDKTVFSNTLEADATEYIVPESGGGADSFLKELEAEIVAVGPDDSEMVRDGIAFTAEPPPCE